MTRVWSALLAACAVLAAAPSAGAQTVDDVASSLSECVSLNVEGLSNQVFDTLRCRHPGYLVPVDGGPQGRVHPAGGVYRPIRMWLRPDARDRLYALAADYGDLYLTETFRTCIDQELYAVASRRGTGGCLGSPAHAGFVRHETGVAVDMNNGGSVSASTPDAICCRPLGSGDPPHFECRPDCVSGSGSTTPDGTDRAVSRWGVEAFQHLWNVNNPGDPIDEDGIAGPVTLSRILASPAHGFSRGGCAIDADGDGVTSDRDCNDHDPRIHPGLPEACDGLDNDCNGTIDAFDTRCGSSVGACRTGTRRCVAAQWGACVGGTPPTPERCDGLDNDCEGAVDDGQVCEREAYGAAADAEGGSTDVNGDGRADACMRTPEGFRCLLAGAHGFGAVFVGPSLAGLSPGAAATVRMGDVTGDGRADLCARVGARFRCWRAGPMGFDDGFDGPLAPDGLARTALADVDGDGRDDLCLLGRAGLVCHPSTGGGFDPAVLLPALAGLDGDVHRWGSLRLGDLDGDGRDDVCARGAGGVRCWRAEGAGFGEAFAGPAWRDVDGFDQLARAATVRLADVTGDGRADLCARSAEGFVCHPFEGPGFGPALEGPRLADADGWSRQEAFTTLRMADVSGDGREDLCGRIDGRVRCWLAGAQGFDTALEGPSLPDDEGWGRPERYASLRLADLTGDGLADLAIRGADGLRFDTAGPHGFEVRWRADAWGASLDAPMYADTLRIAGGGRRGQGAAVEPGCACGAAGPRRGPRGAALALALALVVGRRRRALSHAAEVSVDNATRRDAPRGG